MTGFVTSSAKINSRRQELRGGTKMKFPSDLGPQSLLMNFIDFKYDPNRGQVTNTINSSSILLPLPANLQDTLNVQATNAELGLTGAAVVAAVNGLSGGNARQLGTDMVEAIGEFISKKQDKQSNDNARDYISTYQAAARFLGRGILDAIPGAGLALNVTSGTAVNPHATINFEGVTLRSHTFSWTFSPKSSAESDTLNSILKFLKKSSLPSYKSAGAAVGAEIAPRALLTYPKLVTVSMLGINQDYFFQYKPSMIQVVDVRYNQGDTLALFAGGKPVVITLTIQMIEAEIHTAEDY